MKLKPLMRPQKYICLQLTSRSVRLVELIWRDGNLKRIREDSRRLPKALNHPQGFQSKIEDPLANSALVETVNNLLSGVKGKGFNQRLKGIGGQKVFVSLSSPAVLLKWIALPQPVPQADVRKQRQAIETALVTENYIPVPLETAAYDFHLMNPTTLLVGWMRQGALDGFLEALRKAGVEQVYLTPQSVPLATHLLSEGAETERVWDTY